PEEALAFVRQEIEGLKDLNDSYSPLGPIRGVGWTGPSSLEKQLRAIFPDESIALLHEEAARLGALAEHHLNEDESSESMVFVDARRATNEVGCGIVLGGQVHRGRGQAGRLLSDQRSLSDRLRCLRDTLDPELVVVRGDDKAAIDILIEEIQADGTPCRSSRFGRLAAAEGGAFLAWQGLVDSMV
ncbi:MAG: ROK family protein, partial [Planctomycetes bacterium]|nr:ROK family protein [Planctomycetota bacterium]